MQNVMMRRVLLLNALIVLAVLVSLPSVGNREGVVFAQTPPPGPTSEITTGSETPTGDRPAPIATRLPEGAALTRTPEPTATPGLIVEGVSKVAEVSGLAGESFLGFPVALALADAAGDADGVGVAESARAAGEAR